MKKRCEICGKIYEHHSSCVGYLNMSYSVATTNEDGLGVENINHITYQTCTDCVKKVDEFINGLIDTEDNTKEPKETDAPKKTGHWSLCYSPVEDVSIFKCSACEFILREPGRVDAFCLDECPECKAKMEVYVRDYSY